MNLAEWSRHLLDRLDRQIPLTDNAALKALREELGDYVDDTSHGAPATSGPGELAVPLRLRSEAGELRFIRTGATFGTAVEITASELSIESFFPTDELTAEVVRAAVEQLPPQAALSLPRG